MLRGGRGWRRIQGCGGRTSYACAAALPAETLPTYYTTPREAETHVGRSDWAVTAWSLAQLWPSSGPALYTTTHTHKTNSDNYHWEV